MSNSTNNASKNDAKSKSCLKRSSSSASSSSSSSDSSSSSSSDSQDHIFVSKMKESSKKKESSNVDESLRKKKEAPKVKDSSSNAKTSPEKKRTTNTDSGDGVASSNKTLEAYERVTELVRKRILMLDVDPTSDEARNAIYGRFCACDSCFGKNRATYRDGDARPNAMPIIDFLANNGDALSRAKLGGVIHEVAPCRRLRFDCEGKSNTSRESMIATGRDVSLPSFNMFGAIPKVFTEEKLKSGSVKSANGLTPKNVFAFRPAPKTIANEDWPKDYKNPTQNLVLLAAYSNVKKASGDVVDEDKVRITYRLVPARFLLGGCDGGASADDVDVRHHVRNLQWLTYPRLDAYSVHNGIGIDGYKPLIKTSEKFFNSAKVAESEVDVNPKHFLSWYTKSADKIGAVDKDLETTDHLLSALAKKEPVILRPYVDGDDSDDDAVSKWDCDVLMDFARGKQEKDFSEKHDDGNYKEVEWVRVKDVSAEIQPIYSNFEYSTRYVSAHMVKQFKDACTKKEFSELDRSDMPTLTINKSLRDNLVKTFSDITKKEKASTTSEPSVLGRCLFVVPLKYWKLVNADGLFKEVVLKGCSGTAKDGEKATKKPRSPKETTSTATKKTKKSGDDKKTKVKSADKVEGGEETDSDNENKPKAKASAKKTSTKTDDRVKSVKRKRSSSIDNEDGATAEVVKLRKTVKAMDVAMRKQGEVLAAVLKKLNEGGVDASANQTKPPTASASEASDSQAIDRFADMMGEILERTRKQGDLLSEFRKRPVATVAVTSDAAESMDEEKFGNLIESKTARIDKRLEDIASNLANMLEPREIVETRHSLVKGVLNQLCTVAEKSAMSVENLGSVCERMDAGVSENAKQFIASIPPITNTVAVMNGRLNELAAAVGSIQKYMVNTDKTMESIFHAMEDIAVYIKETADECDGADGK